MIDEDLAVVLASWAILTAIFLPLTTTCVGPEHRCPGAGTNVRPLIPGRGPVLSSARVASGIGSTVPQVHSR